MKGTPLEDGMTFEDWRSSLSEKLKPLRSKWESARNKRNKSRTSGACKRLRHLLYTSPKKAHRRIFETETQRVELGGVYNKAGDVTSSPKDVIDGVHEYFREMAEARPYDATVAPPWTAHVPQPSDEEANNRQHMKSFTWQLFEDVVSHLSNNKAPGPDQVRNEWLKDAPEHVRQTFYQWLHQIWLGKTEAPTWFTHSHTILLYKKGDQHKVGNYRPIALAQTLYKVYTSCITRILQDYAEVNHMLCPSQCGSRPTRSTSKIFTQYIAAIESAHLTKSDIFSLYVDFSSAFNTIGHQQLLYTLRYFKYPEHIVRVIDALYKQSTTQINTQFGPTQWIQLMRGTIQGDSLSPLIFLLAIDPLLKWLHKMPGLRNPLATINYKGGGYVDDLNVVADTASGIQEAANRIHAFSEWGGLRVNISPSPDKTAVTAYIAAREGQTSRRTATLHRETRKAIGTITLGSQQVPILLHDEAYKYMGIWISLDLKWDTEFESLRSTVRRLCTIATRAGVSLFQRRQLITRKILPILEYHMSQVPFSDPQARTLMNMYHTAIRKGSRLRSNTTAAFCTMPTKSLGLGCPNLASKLRNADYENTLAALRDTGSLGSLSKGLYDEYRRRFGDAPSLFQLRHLHGSGSRFPHLRRIEIREGWYTCPIRNSTETVSIVRNDHILTCIAQRKHEMFPAQPVRLSFKEIRALETLWALGAYYLTDIGLPSEEGWIFTPAVTIIKRLQPNCHVSQPYLTRVEAALETVRTSLGWTPLHYKGCLRQQKHAPSPLYTQREHLLTLLGQRVAEEPHPRSEYLSHPPTYAIEVTIDTEERNPDRDLGMPHANEGMKYFVVKDKLQIHGDSGRWLCELPKDHVLRIWRRSPQMQWSKFIRHYLESYRTKKATNKRDVTLLSTSEIRISRPLVTALRDTFQCSIELFSSIRSVTGLFDEWYTANPVDSLLGAHHDCYSKIWTGSVYAHPDHDQSAAYAAVKWAILSAQATREPVLCTLFLPYNTRSPYRHLTDKSSQCHTLATVRHNALRCFNGASEEEEISHHGHIILLIYNEAGKQRYLYPISDDSKQTLELALIACTDAGQAANRVQFDWGIPTIAATIKRLGSTHRFKRALRKYRPLHRDCEMESDDESMEATLETETSPSESDQSTSRSSHFVFGKSDRGASEDSPAPREKRFCLFGNIESIPPPLEWEHIEEVEYSLKQHHPKTNAIYTDGSASGGYAGSGVFTQFPPGEEGQRAYMFTFDGHQSSLRAELIALREATRLLVSRTTRSFNRTIIFTDSLTSLYLLRRWINRPQSMRYHPHRGLVSEITNLADAYAGELLFTKVKAHSGIGGNEIADQLATTASLSLKAKPEFFQNCVKTLAVELQARNCIALDPTIYHCPPHQETLYPGGWYMQYSSPDDDTTYKMRNSLDLEAFCEETEIAQAIDGSDPRHLAVKGLLFRDARCKQLPTLVLDKTIALRQWPDILQSIALVDIVGENELRIFYQHIYDRVWTTNSHGHPVRDALPPDQQSMCPLCSEVPDTAEHMRGGCKKLLCEYIKRHNEIVYLIVQAYRMGPTGFGHITFDAEGNCSLTTEPPNTVHINLLPPGAVPAERPDIVIIANKVQCLNEPPLTQKSLIQCDGKYDVTLLDPAFVASERNLESKRQEKRDKYDNDEKPETLGQQLRAKGHSVTLTPIALGSRIPITWDETHDLSSLNLTEPQRQKLVSNIWKTTIKSLHRIQKTYRQLQKSGPERRPHEQQEQRREQCPRKKRKRAHAQCMAERHRGNEGPPDLGRAGKDGPRGDGRERSLGRGWAGGTLWRR
jgi:ribonuclease HI